MSTKIFNAYRVVDGKLSTAFRIKKELEPLYKAFVKKTLRRHRDTTVNDIKNLLEIQSWEYMDRFLQSPLTKLTCTELEIALEKIMRIGINWDLNFQASVVIFEDTGSLYIQFFGLDDRSFKDYINLLKSGNVLSDYWYTNISDDGFDDPDYVKREEVWNRIYKDAYTPAQAGFSYDFWSRGVGILCEFLEEARQEAKT